MVRILLLYFFLLQNLFLFTQSDLSIGKWKAHLPYQQGTSVTQSDDKIIYSTPWSIFSIDKSDQSVTFLSKVDGLNDIGINKVRYDNFNNQLFIIYTNGNIDIVKDQEIINIANIKSNNTIVGDKRVNDIHFSGPSLSFISTAFGIVEFNPGNYNFGATILTGLNINQVTTSGKTVYAASDEGVYYFDQESENIIADFGKWEFLGSESGFPDLYDARSIELHNEYIYVGVENVLYKSSLDRLNWTPIHSENLLQLEYIGSTEDRLITIWRGSNFQNSVLFFDNLDSAIVNGDNCSGVPLEAIRDEEGSIWYADLFNNIRRASNYNSSCFLDSYNSPYSEKVSDIVIKNSNVLIASGGVAENYTYLFSREGFYYKTGVQWQNFNQFENSNFEELDLLSIFKVAFHPSNNKIYAGSYWAGLLEYDTELDNYVLFNKNNSTIRGTAGDPARERVSGLAFDENEHLWVAAYNAPEPINVLYPDGKWQSFNTPTSGTLIDVVIDQNGYKWFPVHGSNGGVLVYDSGPSIQNTADDRYRFITRNNSELTTNTVLSLLVDLNGEIWVGTNEGPVIFDCGRDVFDEECRGVRIKVLQDSIVAFLLADQQINTMAVDGADRKWIGTRNGLFVQSAQGDEQISQFTTENSPLFDNEIQALAYDGISGEMWIGTNKGIMSFRTATTDGKRVHLESEVYAFPNPVDPDYRGPIAIKGLVKNANVKITDINGLLVAELAALGGQAVWDGLDQKGNEVASGVYLVFSADADAFDQPESFVTKIMILR